MIWAEALQGLAEDESHITASADWLGVMPLQETSFTNAADDWANIASNDRSRCTSRAAVERLDDQGVWFRRVQQRGLGNWLAKLLAHN